MGSWKTMPIFAPRMFRISSWGSFSRSWPSKMTSPSMMACFLLMRPMVVSMDTLLPEPDSPTIPRVSPGEMENETPSTALTRPSSVGKCTFRFLTSNSGSATSAPPRRGTAAHSKRMEGRSKAGSRVADPGVEVGVDDVHQEVGEHDEEGRQERGGLDCRQVGVQDGPVGVQPDALHVERDLREDGPSQQEGHVHPEHRHHWGEGPPEAVLEDHGPLGQALG